MQVILHIGAHRCATTTFQSYLRGNAERLMGQSQTGFWGPRRTRRGLLNGLIPAPGPMPRRDMQARAEGRVRMNLAKAVQKGVQHLVVTDENMMGSMRENLAMGALYCGVGERMSRVGQAFDGQITDVLLNVRAQDSYWPSALGYLVGRGRAVPSDSLFKRLAASTRTWRDVITDIACALPGTRVHVMPFEVFGGRPDLQLFCATGNPAPRQQSPQWLNATPRLPHLRNAVCDEVAQFLPDGDGRWQPFDKQQRADLAEAYADDMMWLTAGADGLATLAEDPDKTRSDTGPAQTDLTRGRPDDDEERGMAQAR